MQVFYVGFIFASPQARHNRFQMALYKLSTLEPAEADVAAFSESRPAQTLISITHN